MRIPARKRKELAISGTLCVIFYILSFVLLKEYLTTLSIDSPPATYAQERQVQGAQDQIATATIPPTNTPTPTKTKLPAPPQTISPTQIPQPTSTGNSPEQPEPTVVVTQTQSEHSPTQDILTALNAYRQKKGIGPLSVDSKLQEFAQSRADHFSSQGDMDNHAGFQSMMSDNGFAKMGFNALGENSSYGEWGSAQNLIETIYGKSSAHNESQLKTEWTHVGIGTKGAATNLVFGGRKI